MAQPPARHPGIGVRVRLWAGHRELERFGVRTKDLPKIFRPYDAVTYADPARKRGLFLVNGIFDPMVPLPLGQGLWEAYGKPNRMLLPSGHVTTAVFSPWLLVRILRHMGKTLKK